MKVLNIAMVVLYGEAMWQLGKLDKVLCSNHIIQACVYKEALFSSSLDGVNATLFDLFAQQIVTTHACKETRLVMRHIDAFSKTLSVLKNDKLSLVEKMVFSIYKEEMSPKCAFEFETYCHAGVELPALMKAAQMHARCEIADIDSKNNGRMARLLSVLLLIESGILTEPLIYPSFYFKKRHVDYYKLLDDVKKNGNFEPWIKFYLTVVRDSAIDTNRRASESKDLEEKVLDTIISDEEMGKGFELRMDAVPVLFQYPVITVKELETQMQVSYASARKIIADFMRLGFLVEAGEHKRDRLFVFKPYMDLLEKEY